MTHSFIVYFEDMCSKALTPSRLVVTEGTEKGLDMSIQMALQTPVVHSLPWTVRTTVHFVKLLLFLDPFRFGCKRYKINSNFKFFDL